MSDNSHTERDQLILKFVNNILKNMDKPKINNLTEFKNITKTELVIDRNDNLAKSYSKLFLKHFSKKEIKYYDMERIKHYSITLLRSILKNNYELNYVKSIKMNNSNMTYTGYYSIIHK
jgi:hypothetical protein